MELSERHAAPLGCGGVVVGLLEETERRDYVFDLILTKEMEYLAQHNLYSCIYLRYTEVLLEKVWYPGNS